MKPCLNWFANLPLTIVATNSLMLALVQSYAWSMHWALLRAIAPIVAGVAVWKWLRRDCSHPTPIRRGDQRLRLGQYRVTFAARRNPRKGMRTWTMESGKQIAAVAQQYVHYRTGEILNVQARWVPVRILLSADDANAFLNVGRARPREESVGAALGEQVHEVADLRNLRLVPMKQS